MSLAFVVAAPRAGSTAFMRWFETQGYEIFHEPYVQPFDVTSKENAEFTKGWWKDENNTSFDKVTKEFMDLAEKKHVCVKEEAFSAEQYVLSRPDLINKATFVFLLRNPRCSLISIKDRCPPGWTWNDSANAVYDYEILERFINRLKEYNAKVVIVESEQVFSNPKSVLPQLCEVLGVPFKEEHLRWKAKDESYTGDDWRETKVHHMFWHWHKNALLSTGFVALKDDAKESDIPDAALLTYRKSIMVYERLLKQNLVNSSKVVNK